MSEVAQEEEPEYDQVTEASLNGIYVKAQEMDRGHNTDPAPDLRPPGSADDAESHASTHASSHASDAGDLVDAEAGTGIDASADAEASASTHTSDAESRSTE